MFTNPNTSKPVVERLRARAEEIATLCREPLPDGDAGLLEAKYRLDASIEEIAKSILIRGWAIGSSANSWRRSSSLPRRVARNPRAAAATNAGRMRRQVAACDSLG